MQKRNVGLMILISIITCGIWFWYWLYKLADDIYTITNTDNTAGLDLIICLVTCGIAVIYFVYKYNAMLVTYQTTHNLIVLDNGLVVVLLSLFGLSIISFAILDNEVGKIINSSLY